MIAWKMPINPLSLTFFKEAMYYSKRLACKAIQYRLKFTLDIPDIPFSHFYAQYC